jgi:hypothetical protein
MPAHRKPTALHLVEGTVNVTRHADRVNEPQPTGKPVRPKFVKGRASKLWDEYAAIATWLTDADSHALALWCGLGAEMEKDLKNMTASRISQWRALGAELGFLCASRSRISVKSDGKKQNAKDKFYA